MRYDFAIHVNDGSNLGEPLTGALMEPSATLRFLIEYPLTRPFAFEETHPDGSGWTDEQFVDAVQRAYKTVYAAENDPGMIPGMLNRGLSEGPYGIWGHTIDDLILEGAERQEDGTWKLGMGS